MQAGSSAVQEPTSAVEPGLTGMNVADELRSRVRSSFRIINMGDAPLMPQWSGHYYAMPSKTAVPIQDRVDYKRNDRGQIVGLRRDPWGRQDFSECVLVVPEGGDSASIAANLLQDWADEGITVLYGDEHDEKRMELARNRYIRRRVQRCEEIKGRWLEQLEIINRTPGAFAPRPKKNVREALDFLRQHEGGHFDRRRFICWDGEDFDTQAEAEAHLKSMWGPTMVASRSTAVPITDRFEEQERRAAADADSSVPRFVSREPVPVPAALPVPDGPAFLFEKAKELGVKLLKDDLEKLLRGDKKFIKKLQEDLAQAAADKALAEAGPATEAKGE